MSKMKEQQEQPVCEKCGKKLIPAFARFDGDPTFVGCLPHTCEPVKTEEKDKGLAEIELRHTKTLLSSCDSALKQRDQEIERLKALLEQQVKRQVRSGIADRYWQNFAAENNL